MPLNFGGVQQLVRFTLPYSVNPAPDRYADGLGDLTVFDLIVLPTKPVLLAVGPLFVAPTATDRFTGAGRWQAGAAVGAVSVQSWGLVGSLVTYQHSFADDFGREPTSLLTAQPIVFYNLPQGFYLRSSGVWNFDFQNDLGYIPVGLGAGQGDADGQGHRQLFRRAAIHRLSLRRAGPSTGRLRRYVLFSSDRALYPKFLQTKYSYFQNTVLYFAFQ